MKHGDSTSSPRVGDQKTSMIEQSGFGLIGVLLVIVVLVVVGGTGVYAWHKHSQDKPARTSKSTTSSTGQSKTSTSTATTSATPNPYSGWSTYCDTVYHYCFKYPNGWQLTSATASSVGGTAQTTLLNSAKTVSISYVNAFVHDSGLVSFTPTSIQKLTSANEDLTVVGGYSPAGGLVGNYQPSYRVVDSKDLASYPLTIGQTTQFPNNPSFTDENTGSSPDVGELVSLPATTINTVADAQTWLNSADAKTSLQILESLYYQQ